MTSPSRTLNFEQLSTCSVCKKTKFYPLWWPCMEHSSCFKCVSEHLENNKLVEINLNMVNGVEVTYTTRCPVCNAEEVGNGSPATVPTEFVRTFHSMRKDKPNTVCPYCQEQCLVSSKLEDNYNHLSNCTKRPVRCSLCGDHFTKEQYFDHIRYKCKQFTCQYRSCTDGKSGMTLTALRAHNMSHEQQNTARDEAEQKLREAIQSLPVATRAQRVNFVSALAAGLDVFMEALSNVRT